MRTLHENIESFPVDFRHPSHMASEVSLLNEVAKHNLLEHGCVPVRD
ncbi:MAG: hypothetical protein M3Q09_13050 [Gemmatimonadota bacterium]|nr:hypothetical protein [Gemmatimonadota bacterium]